MYEKISSSKLSRDLKLTFLLEIVVFISIDMIDMIQQMQMNKSTLQEFHFLWGYYVSKKVISIVAKWMAENQN